MNKYLATNEGTADRVIRVLIGLAGISLVFFGPKSLWGLVGIIPVITGLAGKCPLYAVLGINTCGMRKAAPQG